MQPASVPSSKLPFHPGLEGLRGISVLAVLVFHAWPSVLPGGFLGVSTFFTLSGFLITGLLVDEWRRRGRIDLVRFWGRRLRRLLPASLIGLVAIALTIALWGDVTQQDRVGADGLAALFYVANWWLIATGADYDSLVGSPSPIQHFWSLSIEEQYYLIYPLVTVAILRASRSRSSHRVLAATLGLAAAMSWLWMGWLESSDATTGRIYYGTDARCGELLAGGFLAIVLLDRPRIAEGRYRGMLQLAGVLAMLGAAAAWFVTETESVSLYRWGFIAYTGATLVTIVAAVQHSGPIQAFFGSKLLRWLGRISYGLYVYHWPVLLWLNSRDSGFSPTVLAIAGVTLSLGIAAASYRWIEEPIRAGRQVTSWRRWVAAPASIGTAALVLASVGPQVSVPTPSVAATASTEVCPPNADGTPSRPRPLRIAVVGDSFADNVAVGLNQWAMAGGRAVVSNMTEKGCGIARGAWVDSGDRRRNICDRGAKRLGIRMRQFRPDLVVAVTLGWDLIPRKLPAWSEPRMIGDPEFDRWLIGQYGDALEVFESFDAEAVWLTSPCSKGIRGHVGVSDPKRSRHLNEYILPRLVEEYGSGGVTIVDLDKEICPNGEFTWSLHGIEKFRSDGRHLSPAAMSWLGGWLGPQLLEVAGDSAKRCR